VHVSIRKIETVSNPRKQRTGRLTSILHFVRLLLLLVQVVLFVCFNVHLQGRPRVLALPALFGLVLSIRTQAHIILLVACLPHSCCYSFSCARSLPPRESSLCLPSTTQPEHCSMKGSLVSFNEDPEICRNHHSFWIVSLRWTTDGHKIGNINNPMSQTKSAPTVAPREPKQRQGTAALR
jgi:hypothetical protein